MNPSKLTVKIHTEKLCEYDYGRYVVMAMYMNNKFSNILTIDTENEKAYFAGQ